MSKTKYFQKITTITLPDGKVCPAYGYLRGHSNPFSEGEFVNYNGVSYVVDLIGMAPATIQPNGDIIRVQKSLILKDPPRRWLDKWPDSNNVGARLRDPTLEEPNDLNDLIDADGLIRGTSNSVDHPNHYGGKDNIYEAIKVIDAWELDFCLGNAVKYISRAGKKDPEKEIEDLKKAVWYLQHKINKIEQG